MVRMREEDGAGTVEIPFMEPAEAGNVSAVVDGYGFET